MKLTARIIASAALVLGFASSTMAVPVNGTGNVTPDVIYGSGNANGAFTGETLNNVEVGLRAHQRYPAANIFNYDGVNTYYFDSSTLTTNPSNRSVFNFDWSINVDQSGLSGAVLSDFTYMLSYDLDPTAGVSFAGFDPIAVGGDHAFGDNSTGNGGGTQASSTTHYATLIANSNVAQNSWNLGFGFSADPDAPGIYSFMLEVFSNTNETLASTTINVVVSPVPIPAALPLLAGALGLFGFASHRRRKQKAA